MQVTIPREAGANIAPLLGDLTGPCHDWAIAWDGLNAFGARTPSNFSANSVGNDASVGALASDLVMSAGLDASNSSSWMRGYVVCYLISKRKSSVYLYSVWMCPLHWLIDGQLLGVDGTGTGISRGTIDIVCVVSVGGSTGAA